MRMWGGAIAWGMLLACSGDLALEGRPCPCAEGWTCCERTDECVRTAAQCGPTELTQLIGIPGGKGTADGVGRDARFSFPTSMVGDAEFLYVTDGPLWKGGYFGSESPSVSRCMAESCSFDPTDVCLQEHCSNAAIWGPFGVRRISRSTGETTWLVSDRFLQYVALEGPALFAATTKVRLLDSPYGMYPDVSALRQIVKIDPGSGVVSTLAGVDEPAAPRDGGGTYARFGKIGGLASDGAGALYAIDRHYFEDTKSVGFALRRIDVSTRVVTSLAASPGWSGDAAAQASFVEPVAVAFHDGGVFIVAQGEKSSDGGAESQSIWRYDTKTSAVIKLQMTGYLPWNNGVRAFCFDVRGEAVGVFGNCVGALKKSEVASACRFGDLTLSGSSDVQRGSFSAPAGIWCDAQSSFEGADGGAFYVADTGNGTIRRLREQPTGVGTLAGEPSHGGLGYHPELPGKFTELSAPSAISSDAGGNVVFLNAAILTNQISPGLIRITPGAGASAHRVPELGPGSKLALGPNGVLYFTSSSGIAQLDFADLGVTPLVETLGAGTYPEAIAHDGEDSLYVAYRGSGLAPELSRVERIDAFGTRELLASGYGGPLAVDRTRHLFFVARGKAPFGELFRFDLSTREAQALPTPDDGWEATALAYDPAGTLYVAESHRQRVRRLVLSTGEISDAVGRPGQRGVKLGPLPAGVNQPFGIALLPGGSLAISDSRENVVLVAR
jgi:hypothetical protein